MNLEQPTRALLDLVETDRAARIEAILGEAQRRADAVRAQARSDARARVRQAFAEQRETKRERIAAAQAHLETQRRHHAQQRCTALLQLARQRLPSALLERWQDPTARADWVAQVLSTARSRLPASSWRVVHPADWPSTEQQELARSLQAAGLAAPRCDADAQLRAGLKIVAEGNVIDGTLDGLLADRGEHESRLLLLLESQR